MTVHYSRLNEKYEATIAELLVNKRRNISKKKEPKSSIGASLVRTSMVKAGKMDGHRQDIVDGEQSTWLD